MRLPIRYMLQLDWFSYTVAPGANESQPGLYEWEIEAAGSYIGKFTSIKRPTRAYSRNVSRLRNMMPYRPQNPDGFRRVHHALALAHNEGRAISLTILENPEVLLINRREQELIAERGALNDPPFGRRRT